MSNDDTQNMSNDNTQNIVFLKIDINGKNIVGIGNSIGTITDVKIPIGTVGTDVAHLQRQIKAVTGTFSGNPVEMSIEDAKLNPAFKQTDAGNKILKLIKLIEDGNFPMNIIGPESVKSKITMGGSNKQVGGIFGKTLTLGKRPNTPLGSEIYDKWIIGFKNKFPNNLERLTRNVPEDFKKPMRQFIDGLTDAVTVDTGATATATAGKDEAVYTGDTGATTTAPAGEDEAVEDEEVDEDEEAVEGVADVVVGAEVELPPPPVLTTPPTKPQQPSRFKGARNALGNAALMASMFRRGGKNVKHTKRNKRNKHRRTKRRQSRNT